MFDIHPTALKVGAASLDDGGVGAEGLVEPDACELLVEGHWARLEEAADVVGEQLLLVRGRACLPGSPCCLCTHTHATRTLHAHYTHCACV